MNNEAPALVGSRSLWIALGMTLLVIASVYVLAQGGNRTVQAQTNPLGLEITKTLNGSSTVRIGDVLTFTIRITNTGSLPITELVVIDTFDSNIVAPSGIGPYAKPGDPPLTAPAASFDGNETITWTLFSAAQPFNPGESVTLLVRLRAVRPTDQLQIVNRARIERAIRSDGSNNGGGEADAPAQPGGARLPMTKTLGVPQPVTVGLPITFTIVITNDGAIDLVTLPLRDAYNPAVLQFNYADPPPSSVNATTGVLEWNDLLVITGRGRLRPGEVITVTTVYTALRSIEAVVNRAEVSGARDEYDNAINPRRAEAPIRIVPGDQATPTSTVPSVPTDIPTEEPTEEPTRPATAQTDRPTEITGSTTATTLATATTEATAEAAGGAVATPTPQVPAALPRTGSTSSVWALWLLVGVGLLLLGLAVVRRQQMRR